MKGETPSQSPGPAAQGDSREAGIALEVDNVSKLYRLYPGQRARIIEWITFGKRVYHYPFWALRGISFTLKKGTALGLIGPNGSGKSTLLKLIAGTSTPTSGEIVVNGRIAALLELGAGFHGEFTGRQNIRMNAQIYGLGDEEIDELMPEIIEFAELDRYIDMPVRTYSSGMYARLGFAVASHLDPDVLIIDEALSVGDAYFQHKSLDRIIYFRECGKTILFVSHVLPVLRRFCDEVIWLDEGGIKARGPADKVTKEYDMWSLRRQEQAMARRAQGRSSVLSREKKARFRVLEENWGTGEVRITKVEMLAADGDRRWHFEKNESGVTIRVHYYAFEPIEQPIVGINFHRIDGVYIFGTNNFEIESRRLDPIRGLGYIDYRIGALKLHKGAYFLSVGIFPEPDIPYWLNPADFHNQMYQFTVVAEGEAHGIVPLDGSWLQGLQVADKASAGVPDRLDLASKMAPHYLHSGWYDIEHADEFSFAWTLAEAHFLISQNPRCRRLTALLKCNKPDIAAAPVSVELRDGAETLDAIALKDNEWREVSFRLPPVSDLAVRHLHFRTEPTWRPLDYGIAGDDRELGIGIRVIRCLEEEGEALDED